MAKVFALSEAASIALHSMVIITRTNEMLNVVKISEMIGSSKHHVAKVLQRLVKEDILDSSRGPFGGFMLKKDPEKISLLQIYEAIEGKIDISECPVDNQICPFNKCILGTIGTEMTNNFVNYLQNQTLKSYL